MKKPTSNFFLLLKQGFKGVFKFKAQFIIILVLSFLATLILTVSVSTSRRLQQAYDRVVKPISPFDYTGGTRVADSASNAAGGTNIAQLRSIALTDFVNNTFVNAVDKDGVNTSSYNFIFNSQAYASTLGVRSQNFMTKVIDNDFYDLTFNHFDKKTSPEDYKWDLKEAFARQLIKDLIIYRSGIMSAEVAYLSTTSIGFLLQNQPAFLDFFKGSFQKSDFSFYTDTQKRFVRYIYWTSAQIATWIVNQDQKFASGVPIGNPDSVFVRTNASTSEEKTEAFYEFITGKAHQTNSTILQIYLIENGEQDTYALSATKGEVWDETNGEKYLYVDVPTPDANTYALDNAQTRALLGKGYRGTTSPLSIILSPLKTVVVDGGITQDLIQIQIRTVDSIVYTENYDELALLDAKQVLPLVKQFTLKNNFNVQLDIAHTDAQNRGEWNASSGNVMATMFQYHVELDSISAGFDVRFRKEAIVFDNITGRNFRYVLLNGRDNANFTMLRGVAPTSSGEVAISEQFAKKNKIKVGQYLNIGQATLMVTGFATDAFTFFPNTDPEVPIPQPKTEAFVYGSVETLRIIFDGIGEGSSGQNANPQFFNFFLTNNSKQNLYDLITKQQIFIGLQMDLTTTLKDSFTYLQNLQSAQVNQQNLTADLVQAENAPLKSFFSLKDFKSSNYRLSWTLLPLTLKVFDFLTYIASAIVAAIAIVALVICIRKTITFNAKQIGILKAMGTNPWMISVTYLAHSIIIIGVIVPVAWILGTALQVPFAGMFTTYFSAQSNIVLIDWISIVIAFFGFGILALVTSIFAAYLVTKKSVVEIIDISVKWSKSKLVDKLKNTVFKNASFHYRFSLTLTSSGKKPVILLVIVVGLTSLLISGAIAVPAIANTAVTSYYKSVKYANAYENMTPTMNSPLSKTAINFWQGNERWDGDWWEPDKNHSGLKLDGTNNEYGYYHTPNAYMDLASQDSPIPRYIFKTADGDETGTTDSIVQNFTYASAYLLAHPNLFVDLIGTVFGNNFFTVLGQTFNIGTVDQFLGLILNSEKKAIQEFMGDNYNNESSLDQNKQNLAINFSGYLTKVIPQIIGIIMNASGTGKPIGGDNWKQEVMNVILDQTPPYVRKYIEKSPSRLEQFGISFNAETYVPKKETFTTALTVQTAENNDVKVVGLDQNQQAYAISQSQNQNLYLSDQDLDKVQTILNGDGYQMPSFSVNGLQIWNREANKLTFPMLDNHQSAAGYHLKKNGVLSNLSTTTRQLTFRSKDAWQVLPKDAWAYDDSDFRTSKFFKKASNHDNPIDVLRLQQYKNWSIEKKDAFAQKYKESAENNNAYNPVNDGVNHQHSSWLDVYAIDNNKFTYKDNFISTGNPEEIGGLNDEAYLFNDFSVQNDQIFTEYVRPYYQYKNIKLFLPADLINENDILKSMAKPGTGSGWHKEVLVKDYLTNKPDENEYAIPESVLKAWGMDRKTNAEAKFLMINPYDLAYSAKSGEGLNRLIKGEDSPYWLRYAFDSDNGPGALNYSNTEPVIYGRYNPKKTNFQIDLQVVGTIDSYESKLLVIDANLANMLLGYSTARFVGASITYLGRNLGPDKNPNNLPRPWEPKLDTYTFNSPQLEVLVDDNDPDKLSSMTYMKNLSDAYNYQPLRWHTGKLSNVEEPEGLTSNVSFNIRDNLGQNAISLGSPGGLGISVLITGQTLLSTQKALVNQIYSLSISLGALLIIAIILTASLLIMLVGDIYIAQYQRFMILMRALGYSNWLIQLYAFGTVSLFSILAWLAATILAWLLIFGGIKLMLAAGFAIPYGLSWWPPLLSFAIICVSLFGSLFVSSYKVRKGDVADLVNETSE